MPCSVSCVAEEAEAKRGAGAGAVLACAHSQPDTWRGGRVQL